MRGTAKTQPEFLSVLNLNQRIPADHPLRGIKQRVDAVLTRLSGLFDQLYAKEGRPSIPPEQLLKSRVLMALYSVRSERLFCDQLGYNLLWLWFLDRSLEEGSFDPTVFSHNAERVLSAEAAKLFFVQVYDLSKAEGWTSDSHFTSDGTLIEAWASIKSFVRKDGQDDQKVAAAKDDDPGNPTVNFRGEKRTNDTHQSTTDPESVLYKKAAGKEAKLSFGAHALMENRNGFCADITVHDPIADDEPTVALAQIDTHRELHEAKVTTVGADKNYHQKKFVAGCRQRKIQPHVACKEGVQVEGPGRPHDPARELSHQPKAAQASRRNLWVDENGGRPAAHALQGKRADASLGLLCGQQLQSVAHGQAGPGLTAVEGAPLGAR